MKSNSIERCSFVNTSNFSFMLVFTYKILGRLFSTHETVQGAFKKFQD